MAVQFEAIFVSICEVDVDLWVLKVDSVLIQWVSVHGEGDLILEEFSA